MKEGGGLSPRSFAVGTFQHPGLPSVKNAASAGAVSASVRAIGEAAARAARRLGGALRPQRSSSIMSELPIELLEDRKLMSRVPVGVPIFVADAAGAQSVTFNGSRKSDNIAVSRAVNGHVVITMNGVDSDVGTPASITHSRRRRP
jgi:hypothetical protein